MRTQVIFRILAALNVSALLAMFITATSEGAPDPCNGGLGEQGPHYGNWSCFQPGSLGYSGQLSWTSNNFLLGTNISSPVLTGTIFNPGKKTRWVYYDCPDNYYLNHYETNNVTYTPQLLFVPAFPSIASPVGVTNFAVAVQGIDTNGICSTLNPVSLGTVTIRVWDYSDSDYDGIGDYQEIVSGTDPNDSASVTQKRLGYWPFDNTNTWAGSAGQLPFFATNVAGVPSWNTNAAMIDDANTCLLTYRDTETNGNANINLQTGTIRFWFKPNWGSLYANSDGSGAGPGHLARLIEVGKFDSAYTNGWWGLNISSDGYFINFGSSTNGGGSVNLSSFIFWNSNDWHWLVLTYSSTSSILYLDGCLATSGPGVVYLPNATERAAGFRIGSDSDGSNQAAGIFDEMETFNYAFNESEALDSNQDGIPDSWALSHGFSPIATVADLPSSSGSGFSNLQEYLNSTQPFTIFVATPWNATPQH